MAVQPEYLLHALGHVMGGQRRAGNVADVAVDLERACARLADELREPARLPHLAAIGLAILQDVDAMNLAARTERYRVVDEQVLADHAVEHEQADRLAAGLRLPQASGLDLDEARRRRKGELLRLRDREILHGMRRGGDRYERRRRRGPLDPMGHGSSGFQKKNTTPPRIESELAPAGSRLITFW